VSHCASIGYGIKEVLLGRQDQIRLVILYGLRGARGEQIVRDRRPDLVDVARPECGKLYSVDALTELTRNA